MNRDQARRIVAAVRNGLVGRSRLKQSHCRPARFSSRQRVLEPLDVGRGVAGKLRRAQERHLGAVVPAIAAISSESVETITDSKTPLSSAGAIVYASIGWPPSARTFLPGTRLEPCRAGMKATAEGNRSLDLIRDCD